MWHPSYELPDAFDSTGRLWRIRLYRNDDLVTEETFEGTYLEALGVVVKLTGSKDDVTSSLEYREEGRIDGSS